MKNEWREKQFSEKMKNKRKGKETKTDPGGKQACHRGKKAQLYFINQVTAPDKKMGKQNQDYRFLSKQI